MFSNRHFDPVEGSRLYNERLEEYLYAEEVGVDGIMLNEHHNAPFCMQAKANIFASILAGDDEAGARSSCSATRCRWPTIRCGSPKSSR